MSETIRGLEDFQGEGFDREIDEKINSGDKISRLFWGVEEARVVADFLLGRAVDVNPVAGKEIYQKGLALDSNPDEESLGRLVEKARSLVQTGESTEEDEGEEGGSRLENMETKAEHEFATRMAAETVLRVVEDSLRRRNVWDTDESRHRVVLGRKRADAGKSNYASDILTGDKIPAAYARYSAGGPQLVSAIYAPQFQEEPRRNFSIDRQRRSLSHEVGHDIRALTNKWMWRGQEPWAEDVLKKPEKEVLGGYRVGSNMQGSESMGDIFALSAKFEADEGREMTIEELKEAVDGRVRVDLMKAESGKALKARYVSARVALLDHLTQLTALGCGDLGASDLLALGLSGYVSLEKMPILIKGGVMTEDKHYKMKQIVRDVTGWLVSEGERGYRLD